MDIWTSLCVIIPTHIRFFVTNAINSVLNQTYKNFEIIVLNDGSEQKEYYENKLPDNINLITFKTIEKDWFCFRWLY